LGGKEPFVRFTASSAIGGKAAIRFRLEWRQKRNNAIGGYEGIKSALENKSVGD